jgi:hypothetical protein
MAAEASPDAQAPVTLALTKLAVMYGVDWLNNVSLFQPWTGIFFKLALCGCTLRVTSQTYSPEYTTPTQKKSLS